MHSLSLDSLLIFLKSCLDNLVPFNTIQKIVDHHFHDKILTDNDVLKISDIILINGSYLLLFPNISENSQLKLIKKNIGLYNFIQNPSNSVKYAYVLENPSEIMNTKLPDDLYEQFFKIHNQGLDIMLYSDPHENFPLHIMQKYFHCFNTTHLKNYIRIILKKKYVVPNEYISFLYDNVKDLKLKKIIKKSPKYMDQASLILKSINESLYHEKIDFIQKIEINNIDIESSHEIIEKIIKMTKENKVDQNQILDIFYELRAKEDI